MADHYADMMEIARTHQELYVAGVRAGSETSPSTAKLRQLLNRLEHVVTLWDADEPMKAYAELIGAMRDARPQQSADPNRSERDDDLRDDCMMHGG